jgi:DeoR/GlpR family transcriptional regulator of sugar metabolism
MRPSERQRHILYLLNMLNKEWHVKDLASRFKVSELTIRRDLDILAQSGDVIRTLGGCLSTGDVSLGTIFDHEFELNYDLKVAIGKKGARLVKSGDTILLGDGSTIFQLSAFMNDIDNANIYTNNIAAIKQLSRSSKVSLYLLGGKYDYQHNMLLVKGSLIDRILETLRFDMIFIGADAMDSKGQCMAKDPEVARTNQIILRQGREKILLADHSKLQRSANFIYGQLSDFDVWITSKGIDEAQMNKFRKQTKVIEVPPDQLFSKF